MQRLKGWFRHPAFPILVLVLINLLVAAFVLDNYGESWDENSIFIYAGNTVEAYKTAFVAEEMRPALYGPFNLHFYGPLFFALTHLFANWAHGLLSGTDVLHFWHLGYFLAFQVAIVSLYFLCLRWVSKWAALSATLLFNTQPLLWGHAFINPKDIPFLAFFLASISIGLWMVDEFEARAQNPPTVARTARPIKGFWRATSEKQRKRMILVGTLCALLSLAISVAPLVTWAGAWARAAQIAGESSWSFRLLSHLAPNLNAIPLETYLGKFALRAVWIKAAGIVALLTGMMFLVALRVPGLAMDWSLRLRMFLTGVAHPAVIPAGAVLGLAGAMRVVAPAAGFLVAARLLSRAGRRALPMLLIYFSLAALVTYTFWPFLWEAPVANLAASINEMVDFPKDIGVLFNGHDYRSGDLPASYLPVLMSIQLTEPVSFLAMGGAVVALWKWRRDAIKDAPLLCMIAAWFFLPLLAVVILRPTLYDNFRQFFFLLPPLFLFAGLALDFLMTFLRPALYGFALLFLLAPGIFGVVQLHPYEYVYYNSYVGGVAGADGRYELDYWATSYREAIKFLNEIAPLNSAVYLHGPDHMMRRFGRPDLVAVYEIASQQTDTSVYDYAVLTTRFGMDERLFPEGEVVYVIGRQGATFVVVKQLSPPAP